MQKTLAQSKRFKPNALYPALVITLNATILSTYAYGIDEVNLYDATQNDDQVVKLNMIVVTAEQDTHQQAKDEMFSKDVSNIYAGKEEIERYQSTSSADLFKGLNGVYSSDARNAGALDPNIRGVQGEGRVPLTIDGTEQATSVWMGPAGVSNRNYIDPNMVSSILVEKGVSNNPLMAGIGGTVQVKTLQVDDIVGKGEKFGFELKTETSNNSAKVQENGMMQYVGRDYRDIPGFFVDSYGTVSSREFIQMPKENGKNKFSLDDSAYRIAIATKQDNFDLLGAYSYRKRGNYFSGKNGASDYKEDTWKDEAGAENTLMKEGYLGTYFKAGQEVFNTSSEQESTLLKAGLHLDNNHHFELSFMRNEQEFGESVAWLTSWAMRDSAEAENGKENVAKGYSQYPLTEIKQDTWNLNYNWNPDDNKWINLKAGAWQTENDSVRYQNGDAIFGLQRDGMFGGYSVYQDRAWNNYYYCHVSKVNPAYMCGNVLNTPPTKLENIDGRYNLHIRSLQLSNHKRQGFNLSNTFEITPDLNFTMAGDFTKEKLDQSDFSDGKLLTDLNWGNTHMGPRSGSRQQWNGVFNFDWKPTSWLQVNAGARYSDYWSYDDQLAERRRNQDTNWAILPTATGLLYNFQQLLSDDEIMERKNQFRQSYRDYITWATDFMQQYPEAGDLITDYINEYPSADIFADQTIESMRNEDGLIYSNYSNSNGIPSFPSYKYVVQDYNGHHKGFAKNNPFLNGQIDPDEMVENAQGTGKTVPKYIMGSQSVLYAPESSVTDKWEQPKKQKDHAWVPNISVTAMLNDHARFYVRYNEFVRFPSVFESSMALAGNNKRQIDGAEKPEHAYNWEIGYVQNLTGLNLFSSLDYADFRINYFNNRIKDYIDRNNDFSIVQFAEKKLSGIEVLGRLDSGKYFGSLGATYRLKQEICDKDYASYLDPVYNRISACVDGGFPYSFARTGLQPEYSINLDLGTRLLDNKLEIGTRAVYHSEAKNDDEAQFGQSGWAYNRAWYWNSILVLDAYTKYQVNENVNLDFNITNLTNRYYLDPMARVALPAPGRTITAGLTFKF